MPAKQGLEGIMRLILSVTLLVIASMAIPIASDQNRDPADPRVHELLGVVTKVSASSITVRTKEVERELILDKSTRVVGRNRIKFRNDWRFRPGRLGEYVQVGDQTLVTYRDDRTALSVTIASENRLTTNP
jgi:hypothetical protein